MRFAWSGALAASALLAPVAAPAQEAPAFIALPAGNLAEVLSMLAAQTGASFGYDATLPPLRTRALSGRLTVGQALDRLLRRTPFRTVKVGTNVYRIVRRAHPAVPTTRSRRKTPPVPSTQVDDIVITGRKLPELLSHIPSPVAVFEPSDSGSPRAETRQHDVARAIDGLVVAGRNDGDARMYIRGLADSPFDGFSQTAVSTQVDDGRVTYDAAQPGLRLVDIARVEVLKGPQGPLYGTGALGGVFRIVTNRPMLDNVSGFAAASFSAISKGSASGSVEAMVNVPIAADRAALRIVGYSAIEGGWVDDALASKNANQSITNGARVGFRIDPSAQWSLDVTGQYQHGETRDSQYVFGLGRDLERPIAAREPSSTDFKLLQARLAGPIGGLQLVASLSQAWQERSDTFDLTMAPEPRIVPGATTWRDDRVYRVFDQELRIGSSSGSSISWTVGFSHLFAATTAHGRALTTGSAWVPAFELQRRASETAVYAAGSVPIVRRVRLGMGVRVFRSSVDDERQEAVSSAVSARSLDGVTPDVSLSYDLGASGLLYARVATAFRPGGIDPGNSTTGRYQADEVTSFDLGARLRIGKNLSVETNGWLTQWHDMQSDYLETNGLLATHNAGNAAVTGLEMSFVWHDADGWRLRGGITAQHARLYRGENGIDLPEDLRLPLTPDIAFRGSIERTVRIGGVTWRPSVAINYIGATRLSFDTDLDRPMRGYAIVRTGIDIVTGPLSGRISIDNLLDTRADSFAYGNPFTVRAIQQSTPLRPRTVALSLSHAF